MILDFAAAFGGWAWIGIGIVLLGAEVMVPGSFLIWFGLAAIATGAVALGFDAAGSAAFGWQAELLLFLGLSVVTVIVGRRLFRTRSGPEAAAEPNLNHRARACVGRRAVVVEAITGGRGRIALDDTTWLASGPDLPAGTEVRIAAAEGARLTVEPIA